MNGFVLLTNWEHGSEKDFTTRIRVAQDNSDQPWTITFR